MAKPAPMLVVSSGLVLAVAAAFIAWRNDDDALKLPVKPDVPAGYPSRPGSRIEALRQDLTELSLAPQDNGRWTLTLGPAAGGPQVTDVDLRSFVPRVPDLARGNATLTNLALAQREFNRNETRFRKASNTAELRLANNCLRQGLWEVLSEQQKDKDLIDEFHGWFTFPRETYAELFEEVNKLDLADYEAWLVQYPKLDGFEVPLDKLRSVHGEHDSTVALANTDQPPLRFGEQKRKAKLLLNTDVTEMADFSEKATQPVTTATFAEPGFYDPANPVKFDLTWLASPTKATWRAVQGIAKDVALDEVELTWANGHRIILADATLGALPARTEAPATDADTLRLTFGISTPEIYASGDERAAEFAAPRDNYLLLLDEQGNNVDNHTTGVDRAFLWRQAGADGAPDRLHVLLVGYERIAIVADVVLDWAPASRS